MFRAHPTRLGDRTRTRPWRDPGSEHRSHDVTLRGIVAARTGTDRAPTARHAQHGAHDPAQLKRDTPAIHDKRMNGRTGFVDDADASDYSSKPGKK